jgi:putative membrane protein
MATLVDAVRDGRPGDGMVAAVGEIGTILAEVLPVSGRDPQELPDRLIQL